MNATSLSAPAIALLMRDVVALRLRVRVAGGARGVGVAVVRSQSTRSAGMLTSCSGGFGVDGGRHREDHAIGDPREFPVAHERGSVAQKHAQQRGLVFLLPTPSSAVSRHSIAAAAADLQLFIEVEA